MKNLIILFLSVVIVSQLNAQGVGVGTTSPNPSAMLEIQSTNKGLLIPRMTTMQRDAIVAPAAGLMILNLDDKCVDIYDGANWIKNCGLRVAGVDTIQYQWERKEDFGGDARFLAVGFSIGDKGYVGLGITLLNGAQNDFWEYNSVTNAWSQKANFGGLPRYDAMSFTANNEGYAGLGVTSGGNVSDVWKYSPVSNSWVQVSNYPGIGRFGVVAMELGGFGIVGLGNDNVGSSKDMWKYNAAGDSWTALNDFPFYGRSFIDFAVSGNGYIGVGLAGSNPGSLVLRNFLYKLELTGNGTYTAMDSFPGTPRQASSSFAIGNLGYLGTGYNNGNLLSDFWSFDPVANDWEQKPDVPNGARWASVGFAIGNFGYIGTGQTYAGYQKDFWSYTPNLIQGPIYESNMGDQNTYSVNDGNWTSDNNNNVFKTDLSGNVGIGTNDPKSKLDINDGHRTATHPVDRPLYVTGDLGAASNGIEFRQSNGQQGIGFGYNTIYAAGWIPSQSINIAAKGSFGSVSLLSNGNQLSLYPNGRVGINNTDPRGELHLNNGYNPKKLILAEPNYPNEEFFGFGVEAGQLKYHVPLSNDNHIFYSGAPNATTELMRIKGSGQVGIGASSPNQFFSVKNRFGVDESGALHFTNTPRLLYFSEDGLTNKMILARSPAFPTWGLQYEGTNPQLRFLADSNQVMSVQLTENSVEMNKLGVGVNSPANTVDIHSGTARTMSGHPTNLPLYVTSSAAPAANGIEFRSNTGAQGIGFGTNTIYAAGSDAIHDISLKAKGATGNVILQAQGGNMMLAGNGSVGIGLTPTNKLDVQGGATRTNAHPTSRALYVTGTFSDNSNGVEFRHDNGTQGIGFGNNTIYAAGNNSDQSLGLWAKGTAGHLLFSTNSLERMRITGSGNVGIGTTIPDNLFSVANKMGVDANGSLHLKNNYRMIYMMEDGTTKMLFSHSPTLYNRGLQYTDDNKFRFLMDSANIMTVNMNGNFIEVNKIGVGESNPHGALHFGNAISPRKITFYETANNIFQIIGFSNTSTALEYRVNTTSSNHIFYAGESGSSAKELMRLQGNGFVGINTNAPDNYLSVGNRFGVDANGSIRSKNTSRILYYREDAAATKMILSESPSAGAWGLQYVNATKELRYLADSATIMSVDLDGNRVEMNKLGIGTATPNAPLQFANGDAFRKIVLNEVANNDNQFNGFGYHTLAMRYQIGATTNSHVFSTATGAGGSDELMRITGTGFVGIDNATPLAPLHFKNEVATRKVVLFGTVNNNFQFYGFGVDANILRYQVDATTANHVFFAGNGAIDDNELMRITGTGNVGIGNALPHAPLHFNNAADNRKIVLAETTDNDHQFLGFGSSAGKLQYQLDAQSSSHVFLTAVNGGSSTELMRITGNGNVGIGTMTPNAPLQFSNTESVKKIVLHETSNTDYSFSGLGLDGQNMRYQVALTSQEHIFKANTTQVMVVRGNGNLWVGGTIETDGYFAPILQNGFANLGGDFATCGYFKDKMGIVHLKGTVERAVTPQGFVIFTLPAGYRPNAKLVFAAMNGAGVARVDVTAAGNVEVTFASPGTIHLDGITFKAEQ